MEPKRVTPSLEDYLEAILMIQQEKGSARSIDVAAQLGFSKPSVSVAMHKLEEQGSLRMEDDGRLSLTKTGREIAERVYERHRVLTELLTRVGVGEKTAEEDACRIEHIISQETFDKLKGLYAGPEA